MTASPRIPTPEGLNADFYRAAAGGTLHLQRCEGCGRFRHPPRYYCPTCFSDRYVWAPSEGRGLVFSWTVTHVPVDPGWATEIPYVTGVVELEEGVRLVGPLMGLGDQRPHIGLAVVAELDPLAEDFVFISFRGAAGP